MHQIVGNPFCSPTCWLSLPKSALKGGKNVNPGYFCKNKKKNYLFLFFWITLNGWKTTRFEKKSFPVTSVTLKIVKDITDFSNISFTGIRGKMGKTTVTLKWHSEHQSFIIFLWRGRKNSLFETVNSFCLKVVASVRICSTFFFNLAIWEGGRVHNMTLNMNIVSLSKHG